MRHLEGRQPRVPRFTWHATPEEFGSGHARADPGSEQSSGFRLDQRWRHLRLELLRRGWSHDDRPSCVRIDPAVCLAPAVNKAFFWKTFLSTSFALKHQSPAPPRG